MVITLIGLHYAFEGVHEYYGLHAGIVLLIALGVSMVSFMLPKYIPNKSYHIRNKGTNESSLKEEIILTP